VKILKKNIKIFNHKMPYMSLLNEKALALLARQSQNTISLADWMTFRYAKTAAFPTFFLAFNSKSSQRAQWCTLIQQVAL
jgi:hypothetical protein